MCPDRGEPKEQGGRGAGRGYCGGQGQAAGGDFSPAAGVGGGRYRRSVLETSILTLLAEESTHGYDLVDQVSGMASDLVCIDPGSMYRLLRGLEEQGLVSSSWQPAETGPSRRVYAISEQGLEALEIMAESLAMRARSMQRLAEQANRAVDEVRGDRSAGSQAPH